MARLDALANQIATTLVFVKGIIAIVVAGIKTKTESAAAAKATPVEAAAVEAAAAKAVTTTTDPRLREPGPLCWTRLT